MKKSITVAALALITGSLPAQNPDKFFADNNPKLTKEESAWLNSRFGTAEFDFNNKYVGFVELMSGAFYGIGKMTFPLRKKNFQSIDIDKMIHQLIVLDPTEKQNSRGYDALLVLVSKKNKGKLKRMDREKVVAEAMNRYPQIPADAGLDTSSMLNTSNAIFFNEIYKMDLYPNTSFDFSGKKVAIFNSHCSFDKIERISIPEYVARIRKHLDIYGTSMTDPTYYLTEEQKKASGGYDVIIDYMCKKGISLSALLNQLK